MFLKFIKLLVLSSNIDIGGGIFFCPRSSFHGYKMSVSHFCGACSD
jgi:hypothetical protein